MRFMLDTDTCISLIRKSPASVLKKLTSLTPGDAGISVITLAELEYGVAKSSKQNINSEALSEFCAPLEIAEFGDKAARFYGKVRATLERDGTPIGSMDMMIGSHALSLGVTLVTHNTREFSRIDGLKLTDWAESQPNRRK
ncbi:MAG: type II toxin-antitoxin system VapC family toxin [Nitrospinae bacterium]|nr:type II toxin-antitoxin system VapC family toxin [Nitrospinota bacterium]